MYQFDKDKDFTLVNFKGTDGSTRGFLGFFAVHGTSIYENNTLVSSDNKGYGMLTSWLKTRMLLQGSSPGRRNL
jgi:neutral ceramidase